MEIPEHVASLITEAHDRHEDYVAHKGSLHDSSMATVAARDAVCGWLMSVIYKTEKQQTFGSAA